MPGSKGEHLGPGWRFRVMANRRGDTRREGLARGASVRITHPRRVCRGASWAARVRIVGTAMLRSEHQLLLLLLLLRFADVGHDHLDLIRSYALGGERMRSFLVFAAVGNH